MEKGNLVLCLVKDDRAWFTTKKLEEQWGDDWNDIPYEHNAGAPYSPCWHRKENIAKGEPLCPCESCERDWDGKTPRWEVEQIYFSGGTLLETHEFYKHMISVQNINKWNIPWLTSWKDGINIYPGTLLDNFIKTIHHLGGDVWRKVEK